MRRLRVDCRLLAQCGLRRGKPRDRHAEGRARYVVEPKFVAEGDRGRIAAVFAANPEFQIWPYLAAPLGSDADQLANAIAVERHERIDWQNSLCRIDAEKARRVVAADAERRLRQVVGAERKKLRRLRDLPGLERRTRQLDHGPDLVF